MRMLFTGLLFFGLIIGQTTRIPLTISSGITILDFVVLLLNLFGLIKIRFKLKSPPLWVSTALPLIFIMIISLIFTPLKLSVSEFINSFSYTIRFTSYILLGWLIYSEALGKIRKDFSLVLLISGITLAVLGIVQLIFLPDLGFLQEQGWDPHFFRTVSTFLDPNFLGGFLVLTLLVLSEELGKRHSGKDKKWLVSSFFITYISLLTTFSRSSYLMFTVSFLIFSALRKSAVLGVLTILLIIGLGVGFLSYNRAVVEEKGVDRQKSAQHRVSSWQLGWEVFQESPILGVGFNSYRYALDQYNLVSESYIKSRGSSGNDSSLLFIASTTGIIGFISYLAFLFSIFYSAFKAYFKKDGGGVILLSGLSGLIVHSLFINSLFYPWMLIWIVLIASNIKFEHKNSNNLF